MVAVRINGQKKNKIPMSLVGYKDACSDENTILKAGTPHATKNNSKYVRNQENYVIPIFRPATQVFFRADM